MRRVTLYRSPDGQLWEIEYRREIGNDALRQMWHDMEMLPPKGWARVDGRPDLPAGESVTAYRK